MSQYSCEAFFVFCVSGQVARSIENVPFKQNISGSSASMAVHFTYIVTFGAQHGTIILNDFSSLYSPWFN